MERDICDNKTVFRLWKIDLNKTKKVDEIEQFRFEVIDQNGMMALQALFVSHETQKRYRNPNLDLSNTNLE